MKLITFRIESEFGAGWLDGDEVVVRERGPSASTALLRLVAEGPEGTRRWAEEGAGPGNRLSVDDVELLAPFPEPLRDLICVGKNYHAHAEEFHSSGFDSSAKEAVPSHPVIFTKATTSVIGPGGTVEASLDPTASVDYEIELGVVIGRRAFGVSRADAFDHVFGYTIVNDVTSRELQQRHNQWVIGKSIDTFCPMGPWLVTADEIEDVTALELETYVNDERRQQARVADLIFDIPTLIETLSRTMTLLPGDVIATGTPVGVGIGMDPPRYLAAGDRMRLSITGLGTLENPIG